MVTTDLSQCLISNNDGIVSSFLNIEKHHNEDLEMCRIAKLEKLEKDIMRVHFLLEPGSIQLVKEIPSMLPFFLPDKGWSAFSPDKCEERFGCKATKLNCRDVVYFKKDQNVPTGPNRGSLSQRMKSTMFDDSDFCTNNLVYPVITPRAPPVECPKPTEDLTKSKTILMDHILNSNKMQCVRQSKKEEGLVKRDEIMMNRKMKRSIPGDFRSSVESGRTPKHSIKPIKEEPVEPEEKELNIVQTSDNESSEESEDEMSDENNETMLNNNTPIKSYFNQSCYPISKELFPSDNEALLWYLTKSPATPVYRRVISKPAKNIVTVVKTASIPSFCSKTDSFPLLPVSQEEDETGASPGVVSYRERTTLRACPKINLLERFNQNGDERKDETKKGFRLNPNNKECNATQNSINALRMSMSNLSKVP